MFHQLIADITSVFSALESRNHRLIGRTLGITIFPTSGSEKKHILFLSWIQFHTCKLQILFSVLYMCNNQAI